MLAPHAGGTAEAMQHTTFDSPIYEYEVVPAPSKPERREGLRTDAERLAYALTNIFNEMAEDGWEYVRSDTLGTDGWASVTGTEAKSHTLLIFRRPLELPMRIGTTHGTRDAPARAVPRQVADPVAAGAAPHPAAPAPRQAYAGDGPDGSAPLLLTTPLGGA